MTRGRTCSPRPTPERVTFIRATPTLTFSGGWIRRRASLIACTGLPSAEMPMQPRKWLASRPRAFGAAWWKTRRTGTTYLDAFYDVDKKLRGSQRLRRRAGTRTARSRSTRCRRGLKLRRRTVSVLRFPALGATGRAFGAERADADACEHSGADRRAQDGSRYHHRRRALVSILQPWGTHRATMMMPRIMLMRPSPSRRRLRRQIP